LPLKRIDLMLFERAAPSRQPDELIRRELAAMRAHGEITPPMVPNDGPPLGIILCTGKKHEQIELLELDKSGQHVAEYLAPPPPREAFEQKIQSALLASRARLDN